MAQFEDNIIEMPAGAAPSAPAMGNARLYVKNDEKWYSKDSGGTEVPLLGQSQPTALIEGSTGNILLGNAGIPGCVRNGVGDWTVTLAAPTSTLLPFISITDINVPV